MQILPKTTAGFNYGPKSCYICNWHLIYNPIHCGTVGVCELLFRILKNGRDVSFFHNTTDDHHFWDWKETMKKLPRSRKKLMQCSWSILAWLWLRDQTYHQHPSTILYTVHILKSRPVEIKKAGDITLTEVSVHNKPHDCWIAAAGHQKIRESTNFAVTAIALQKYVAKSYWLALFRDPRALLYRVKILCKRVQWFLGYRETFQE